MRRRVESRARTVFCAVCGTEFETHHSMGKYCRGECARIGARQTWRAYQKRRITIQPEKIRARSEVHKAIMRGELVRRPCARCGVQQSEAHHPDYSIPLEIVWLCDRHHREEERRSA